MKLTVLSLFFSFSMLISAQDAVIDLPENESIVHYYELAKKHKKNDSLALSYLDKTIALAKKENEFTFYLKAIAQKSTQYGYVKKYFKAIELSKQLLTEAKKHQDTFYQARAFEKLGRYNNAMGDLNAAYSNYSTSKKIYESIKDTLKIAKVAEKISNIQNDLGDYLGAEETAIDAIQLVEGKSDSNITWLYNVLGRASKEQLQYNEALHWYDKAIATETKPLSIATLKQNKAVIYMKSERYRDAKIILEELLQSPEIKKNTSVYAKILDNLGFAAYYLNAPRAKEKLLEALRIREEINDNYGKFASYIHLSHFHERKNRNTALLYADKAYTIALGIKSPEARLEALSRLMELQPAENAIETALAHRILNDSLQTAKQLASTRYLKFQYESDKLREDNSKLTIAQAAQQLQLANAKNQRLWLFGIAIALLLSGVFIYFFLKERNKKARLQERYRTKKQLSKKIHDELANDVYLIMSRLQSLAAPEDLIDSVEDVYERTRDISKETERIGTGADFQKNLSFLLSTSLPKASKLVLQGLETIPWQEFKKEQKATIYRVLQELMTNMKKHSKATLVAVVFETDQNGAVIRYTDNGTGILNPDNLGVGLTNVENRILSSGGSFTFIAPEDQGFRCEIHIPK